MSDDWHDWDLRTWNDILVKAIFQQNPSKLGDIRRIDATSSFLAQFVGLGDDSATAVTDAFVAVFPKKKWEIQRLYDEAIQQRSWSPSQKHLPFFAQLYFTILIASANDETYDEGDFRKRFARRLGLEEGSYFGYGLPELWRAAAQWTIKQSELGRSVRKLVLPDPGYETIVGYSKKLSFPGHRDQLKLVKLFVQNSLSSTSPVEEIEHSIASRLYSFSTQFQNEFNTFRRVLWVDDLKAIDTPFWSVVEELSWAGEFADKSIEDAFGKLDIKMELDPGNLYYPNFFLLLKDISRIPYEGWVAHKDEYTFSEYKYVLSPDDSETDFNTLGQLLYESKTGMQFGVSYLGAAVREGGIVFQLDNRGRWASVVSLEVGADAFLAAREGAANRVLGVLNRFDAFVYRSDFQVADEAWSLIGPFTVSSELLAELKAILSAVDLFRKRLVRPKMQISKGMSSQGLFLAYDEVLPKVQMDGADRIEGQYVDCDQNNQRFDLTRNDQFCFSEEKLRHAPSPSIVNLFAYDSDGHLLGKSKIGFTQICPPSDLKRIKSTDRWLHDGIMGDLVPLDTEKDETVALCEAEEIYPIGQDAGKWNIYTTHLELDDLPRFWRVLFEIVSCLFSNRQLVPTKEFVDLMITYTGFEFSAVWPLIEDMVANGLIRQVYQRRWRGSAFCAVRPECVPSRKHKSRCRVVGVTSISFRKRLQKEVGKLKGNLHICESRGVLGAIEIDFSSEADVHKFIEDIELPTTSGQYVPPLAWNEIISLKSTTKDRIIPSAKRERVLTLADKSRHGTRGGKNSVDLFVYRYERRPSTYVIEREGSLLSTNSRVWAKLLLYALTNNSIGTFDNEAALRLSSPFLDLPTPINLYNLYFGSGVCGRDNSGRRIYPKSESRSFLLYLNKWVKSFLLSDSKQAKGKKLNIRSMALAKYFGDNRYLVSN